MSVAGNIPFDTGTVPSADAIDFPFAVDDGVLDWLTCSLLTGPSWTGVDTPLHPKYPFHPDDDGTGSFFSTVSLLPAVVFCSTVLFVAGATLFCTTESDGGAAVTEGVGSFFGGVTVPVDEAELGVGSEGLIAGTSNRSVGLDSTGVTGRVLASHKVGGLRPHHRLREGVGGGTDEVESGGLSGTKPSDCDAFGTSRGGLGRGSGGGSEGDNVPLTIVGNAVIAIPSSMDLCLPFPPSAGEVERGKVGAGEFHLNHEDEAFGFNRDDALDDT